MQVLVNGASISRGPCAWPYYLESKLKCNLVNLALAGCGYHYIYENTIYEIAQRKYDLVLIQWPESGRIDIRVDNIEQFSDSHHTSYYQSAQNDWPEKIVEPINDQDYVQKDWIFSLGHLRGHRDSVANFFAEYHKISKHPQIMSEEIIKIIGLQNTLKQQNIPYRFFWWQPYKKFNRFEHLYKLIDWTNVYQETCLETIAKNNQWLDSDGIHPNGQAHDHFSTKLLEHLNF